MHFFRIAVIDLRVKDILRHVDDDWSLPPCARDEKCFLQNARQLFCIFHQVIMLRDRRRDADDIRLLESILPDVRIRHLSCNADEWHRISQRRCNSRRKVRRTRA